MTEKDTILHLASQLVLMKKISFEELKEEVRKIENKEKKGYTATAGFDVASGNYTDNETTFRKSPKVMSTSISDLVGKENIPESNPDESLEDKLNKLWNIPSSNKNPQDDPDTSVEEVKEE